MDVILYNNLQVSVAVFRNKKLLLILGVVKKFWENSDMLLLPIASCLMISGCLDLRMRSFSVDEEDSNSESFDGAEAEIQPAL